MINLLFQKRRDWWLYELFAKLWLVSAVFVKMADLEMLNENSTDGNMTVYNFEVFDTQDLMNVLAYAAMSLSK